MAGKWIHLAQKKIEKNYKSDKEGEKDPLSTLYTKLRFYSSMDNWSKDGMIEYNKLCTGVREEKVLGQNILFEEGIHEVMQERRNDLSKEREKILNESRIVSYSDDWERIKKITVVKKKKNYMKLNLIICYQKNYILKINLLERLLNFIY